MEKPAEERHLLKDIGLILLIKAPVDMQGANASPRRGGLQPTNGEYPTSPSRPEWEDLNTGNNEGEAPKYGLNLESK
ncbi:hypothetical protein cyc_09642 [Cyclospora cayetanensis]|uniref:Uncharacterized protein n=1 Tax=Cyclospora cayetanensis TaxID=88456 RepID=A0A1D3D9Y6_9EIME|nr:hypothetical protein cyc_09642 [Cyclospora cayetanensis]